MDYTRQLELVDSDRLSNVHIDLVGVGSVGSFSGLLLTKMGGQDVRIFDPDVVEEVNLASQLYRSADARDRTPKAVASQAIFRDFSEVQVQAIGERAERHNLRGIVILAVDSMAARADMSGANRCWAPRKPCSSPLQGP